MTGLKTRQGKPISVRYATEEDYKKQGNWTVSPFRRIDSQSNPSQDAKTVSDAQGASDANKPTPPELDSSTQQTLLRLKESFLKALRKSK